MKRLGLLIILAMLCGSCWDTGSNSDSADSMTELALNRTVTGNIAAGR